MKKPTLTYYQKVKILIRQLTSEGLIKSGIPFPTKIKALVTKRNQRILVKKRHHMGYKSFHRSVRHQKQQRQICVESLKKLR